MAVHTPDPDPLYEGPPPSASDGQWTIVALGNVDDRRPQYNDTNLSSAQLGRTVADHDTSEVSVVRATAHMGQMDLGDKGVDPEMEDNYPVDHYPGSNNSGASEETAGGETDRPQKFAPALQGATAPKPQRLTAEMLDIHTRQVSQLYTYPDSTGGWVQRTGPALWGSAAARGPSGNNPLKRPSTSIVSEASSAWIPVRSSSSGITQDIAGVGDWTDDMPAPHHHRHG